MREVNYKRMMMQVDLKMVFLWHDERILHRMTFRERKEGGIRLGAREVEEIWKPDLYIYNLSKFDVNVVLNPISKISILSDKCLPSLYENISMIKYQLEGTASIYCKFNFENYPLDAQTCRFGLTSESSGIDIILKSATSRIGGGGLSDSKLNIAFFNQSFADNCYKKVVGFDVKFSRHMQPLSEPLAIEKST